MLKILVTGAAGCLGSNLTLRLLSQGHEVVALDDFTSGLKENAEELKAQKRCTFIVRDILDGLEDLKELEGVTQVYHLACPASPPKYQADALRTWKINLIGTLKVAEFCQRVGARIMFSSTSEVYGDPLEHPQREEYRGNTSCTGIRACYDEGKRAAETLLFDMHRQFGLEVRIARIFNTYGPRMAGDDGRVITNFILQCLDGKDITIYGDGQQTRSFCYVDDNIAGLQALMEGEHIGPINIGNPVERTILETATIVKNLTGKDCKSQIVFGPLPGDDPTKRCPDISKAKELLGWEPTWKFDDGLKHTIEHFRKQQRK